MEDAIDSAKPGGAPSIDFKALVENSPLAIFQCAPSGACIYANPRWCELSGLSFEQSLGHGWAQAIHPDDRQRVLDTWDLQLERHLGSEFSYRLLTPSGRATWVRVSVACSVGADGQVLGYTGTVHDITTRVLSARVPRRMLDSREGDALLRAREEQLRSALEAAHMGTWDWDVHTNVLLVSPVLYGLLGVPPEAGPTDFPSFLALLHREDRPRVDALLQNPPQGGPFELHCRLAAAPRWLSVTGQIQLGRDGKPRRVLGVCRDITARKTAEEALRQSELRARDAASELQRLSQRLLVAQDDERRRIARELHDATVQGLAAQLMYLERVAADPGLSPPARQMLGEARRLADGAVRELRTLSYLLHPPLLEEVGLASALRWYVAGYMERSGLRVDLDLPAAPSRLPPELETTLFRIVQEGLTNAHRHANGVGVRIRLTETEESVAIEILDEGPGLPPEVSSGARVGVGLASVRERAALGAGTLELGPDPAAIARGDGRGPGTRLCARFPRPFARAASSVPPHPAVTRTAAARTG